MIAGPRWAKLALLPVLLVFLSLLTMAGLVRAQQQPAVESCNYDVGPGVPFVQLHFEASSQSAVAFTVYQGQTLFTVRKNTGFWDGSEWWVEVWTGLPNAKGTYWAEFDRLAPRCQPSSRPQPVAPAPNPEPSRWFTGESMVVRSSVEYVWLRGSPSPTSAAIRTIYSAGGLVIEQQDAARDNLGQWWWLVRDPISNETGWVEQAALEPGALPPTPTLLPTLDLPTLEPPVAPVDILPTVAPPDMVSPTLELPTVEAPVLETPLAPVDLVPTDIVLPTVEVPVVETPLAPVDLLPTDMVTGDMPLPTDAVPVAPVDLVPTVEAPVLETPLAPVDLVPTDIVLPTVEVPVLETPIAPVDLLPTDVVTPPEMGVWQLGSRVRIHPGIPYSWLRIIPSSESAWNYSVTRQELVIVGGQQSDGVQNWWNVAVPSAGANVVGWIEESALELISS